MCAHHPESARVRRGLRNARASRFLTGHHLRGIRHHLRGIPPAGAGGGGGGALGDVELLESKARVGAFQLEHARLDVEVREFGEWFAAEVHSERAQDSSVAEYARVSARPVQRGAFLSSKILRGKTRRRRGRGRGRGGFSASVSRNARVMDAKKVSRLLRNTRGFPRAPGATARACR